MEVLNVSAVQPGMRLARAVFSEEGTLLLPPGEVLDESHLQMLKEWGIQSVSVDFSQDELPEQQAAQPEDLLQNVRQMVLERFAAADLENPHIQVVFELAVERQGRLLLSCPGRVALGKGSSPAFQTPKPNQVSIKPLIESSHRMGTLPVVFQRLVGVLNNSNSTIDEIAQIITTDPALTAKLLRLVNSPFYGLPYKIDTIPRAVVMVGTRQLVMLAMGTTLITAFKGLPVSLVNMQAFWSHSISTGAAARLLARKAGVQQAEGFFVAGLLHDIARLLIYTQLPKHALYMITEAKRRQESVYNLEKETLGFTHDALGKELLLSWRCPDELVQRVAMHHRSWNDKYAKEDVVLPVANMLSQALGYGSSGEVVLPPVPGAVWQKLGLSSEELIEVCRKLDDSVRHLRSLFAG